MRGEIVIRLETAADVTAIHDVTAVAFRDMEVSNQTEPFIVAALREAGALSLSLVAELDGQVVGHVAFSPVRISDGTTGWYGLGPVSVLPELQRKGIGKALIREGLERLRGLGARGCSLVGHPGYYEKVGFSHFPDLGHEGVPPEAFFSLSFDGTAPKGSVTFHEAFFADYSGREATASGPGDVW